MIKILSSRSNCFILKSRVDELNMCQKEGTFLATKRIKVDYKTFSIRFEQITAGWFIDNALVLLH